jgi:hypothetical protein
MAKKSSCRMGLCLRRSPRQYDNGYDMVRFLIDGCACSSVDRASASGAEGHRFKSCQAHQNSLLKCLLDQPSNNLSEWSKWTANKTADVVSTGGVPSGYVEDADKGENEVGRHFQRSDTFLHGGPLAQLVEQLTLNQRAVGSTPTRPTKNSNAWNVSPVSNVRLGNTLGNKFTGTNKWVGWKPSWYVLLSR